MVPWLEGEVSVPRLFHCTVAGLVIATGLSFLFGASGLSSYRALRAYEAHVSDGIAALQDRHRRLQQRVAVLRDNPEALRLLARETGYYRPGETVIEVGPVAGRPHRRGRPASRSRVRRRGAAAAAHAAGTARAVQRAGAGTVSRRWYVCRAQHAARSSTPARGRPAEACAEARGGATRGRRHRDQPGAGANATRAARRRHRHRLGFSAPRPRSRSHKPRAAAKRTRKRRPPGRRRKGAPPPARRYRLPLVACRMSPSRTTSAPRGNMRRVADGAASSSCAPTRCMGCTAWRPTPAGGSRT